MRFFKFKSSSLSMMLHIIILLTLISCKKEEVLPAFTMTGNGTFGCLVNGKVWVPRGMSSGIDLQKFHPNTIVITSENRKSLIRLSITDSTGIKANKTYDLAVKSFYDTEYATDEFGSPCFYETEHIITGYLIFKRYDDIVSGIFEYSAFNPDCKDSVTIAITEGRFDLKSYTGI